LPLNKFYQLTCASVLMQNTSSNHAVVDFGSSGLNGVSSGDSAVKRVSSGGLQVPGDLLVLPEP
jgi:hypothetical protein